MKIYLILILTVLISSCATKRPKGKTAAENLYRDAQEFKKSGRFLLALEKINALRSQYPYSYYATPAELLQADILFAQENYTEAAAAYILFRDFHPRHKRIEYVLFQISDSFFKQLPSTFDRDLAPTYDVIKYSQELVRKFPRSEYASKAKENIEKCKVMQRKKEKYIADFYFKTGVYDSASFRYRHILDSYDNDKKLREHAIVRLVNAAKKEGKFSDCMSYSEKYSSELPAKLQKKVKNIKSDCESNYNQMLQSQKKENS